MRSTARQGMCFLNQEGKKKTPPALDERGLEPGGVFFNYLAIGLAFLPII